MMIMMMMMTDETAKLTSMGLGKLCLKAAQALLCHGRFKQDGFLADQHKYGKQAGVDLWMCVKVSARRCVCVCPCA